MTVEEEWRGHAHDLRRIARMLTNRPTLGIDDQVKRLLKIAKQLDDEASRYEAENA